jgi:curved DNA-binding protein CbpA
MDRSETAPRSTSHDKLYAKLGVPPDASTEAIRRAYRVLEDAYRPGGAYVDDVMHLAFTDISRAASILGNPKTRKLYDRGYIDEFGKRTRTGRVRASRVRTAVLACAFLSIGFAGLAVFSFDSSNSPPESASLTNPPTQRAAQALPPVSQPRPPEETQKSASNEKSGSQGLKASLPLQADTREYLPPEAKDAPENHPRQDSSESSPRLSVPPKSPAIQGARGKPAERRTPNPERRRLARLSRTGPQMLQSYIWFGRPAPNSGPIRASQTLRTAHCLACLTDHGADCSRACS